ncbi:MAG TPA: DUF2167 domain-containing protein [Asticcacaulis sp.]|nr:DUF2167 domain-containing protein [Asticcacaulis sp.]
MLKFARYLTFAALLGLNAPMAHAAGASGDIPTASSAEDDASAQAEAQKEAEYEKTFMAGLHPRGGNVRINEADATLNLGDRYYFLDKAEAKKVIVEAWGNPPSQAEDVLGLVVPAGKTPFNDWGAVVTYEKTDYVSDSDAATANYDSYISEIQTGEAGENKQRQKDGYVTTHLVGWAQPPSYDKGHHYLIWARDIQFGGQDVDTLNYDIRILGRRGVLSLNMVATMPELPSIRTQAEQLAAAGNYNSGARYEDYKKGDAKAAYGLAGLVAAGLGLAVAKKLGLLAVILAFGKKIIVFVLAGLAAIGRWFSSLFGGKKKKAATMAAPPLAPDTDTPVITEQPPTVDKD